MNIAQYTVDLQSSPNFERATTRELEDAVDAVIEEVRKQGQRGDFLFSLFESFLFPTYVHAPDKNKSNAGATTYLIFFLYDKSNAWRASDWWKQTLDAEVVLRVLALLLRLLEMETIPDYVLEHKNEIKDKLVPMLNKIQNHEIQHLSRQNYRLVAENETKIAHLVDFLSA